MSEENIRFVQRIWDAINEGGIESALELTDPDVEWEPHVARGQVMTSDELLRFFNQFRGAREMLEATPYSLRSQGDRVLASGSFRLHGAEGKLTEFQVHWVYRFEQGRLLRATSYATEAEASAALERD